MKLDPWITFHRSPEIPDFQAQDSVGGIGGSRALGLIQRMARGEIHAAVLIDDRGLQRFRELDEVVQTRRRARAAIGDDHRIFGVDQQPRGFIDGSQ